MSDKTRHIGNAPQQALGNETDGWIPKRSTTNHAVSIARGDIEGSQPFGAYGKLVTSGSVTNQVLWADGDWSAPPATGVQVSVVSTSAEDGVDGTGIRSLHVHYLDIDLNPQIEIIILNGLTPVLSTATNIRFIQCAHLETYGSAKVAIGIITFKDSETEAIYNQIDPTENRCSSSARMVPIGKRAVVTGMVGSSISGTASTSSSISIASSFFYDIDYTADSILIPFGSVGIQDGSETFNMPIPAIFPEGSVVAMICATDKSAIITGGWFGWLENAN